ncbi:peroxiredoxin [Isoptericola cucumis]|uniref:peroxiredoxin n=1 Tax=Isoptericola cucumis TaxID=1776856 RepID=UPI00320905BA
MTRLAVGDTAPDLTLDAVLPDPAGTGTTTGTFSLADELAVAGRQGVVVYFYPAAMTPGCTTEACDFRDSLASLQGAGYAVVGVSPDDTAKLATFAERDALTFPLAADPEHAALEAWGAWGEKKNYGKTYVGVIRSTVVVGPDGKVTVAQYNVKATGHVARLRKTLGLD